jgi:uncharacterized protein DUF6166
MADIARPVLSPRVWGEREGKSISDDNVPSPRDWRRWRLGQGSNGNAVERDAVLFTGAPPDSDGTLDCVTRSTGYPRFQPVPATGSSGSPAFARLQERQGQAEGVVMGGRVQEPEPLYKGYRDGYGPGFNNRDDSPPLVLVSRGSATRALPDLAPAGPVGFTWGYPGGGPYNLSRSILADYLDATPSDALTLAFRAALIERLDQNRGWQITGAQVHSFLAKHRQADWVWADELELTEAERAADRALKQRVLGA